jgi:hypothetical protein
MAKFNPKLHRKAQKRSSFEDTIDDQLAKAGVEYAYERTTIPWTRHISSGECLSCGHREVGQRCDYTPDFEVKVGKGFFIEVKGYLDGPDRTKLRAIRKQYPDLDLRLVFQRDNVIKGTKEKTRYSAWATKFGFKFAIGKVPDEWLT